MSFLDWETIVLDFTEKIQGRYKSQNFFIGAFLVIQVLEIKSDCFQILSSVFIKIFSSKPWLILIVNLYLTNTIDLC